MLIKFIPKEKLGVEPLHRPLRARRKGGASAWFFMSRRDSSVFS
jgi:hypothetical protein